MRAARGIVLCVVGSKDRQVLNLLLRNRAAIVKKKSAVIRPFPHSSHVNRIVVPQIACYRLSACGSRSGDWSGSCDAMEC